MANNASESVYRGREGSGEAQVLQGNAGLAGLLRNQQLQAQNQNSQMRMQWQLQQMRNQRDNQLMKADFSKPGTFQQEESMKEIGGVGDLTRKYAQSNPYASRLDIEEAVSQQKNEVQANIARRNQIQESLKNYQNNVTKDSKRYDQQALSLLHDKVFSNVDPSTGKITNKHVKDIDPDQVANLDKHPSAINPHVAILDDVNHTKQQASFSKPGEVINTGLGLMRIDEYGKARFVKEDGTPGISPRHVQGVLDRNPAVEDKFFWEISQSQVKSAGGNPNDIDHVHDVYDKIRHTDDPSILKQVYDKTLSDLEKSQQVTESTKYTNFGKFSEAQKASPTEEDYNITRDQVNSIKNAFEKGNVTGINYLLKNLENKKYNGMFIMKAEPSIETSKTGADQRRIKLTVKVGSAGGYAFKTDDNGNVMYNAHSQPILDYNTPTKSNATETIYLDPRNKSVLFDLMKFNHPEKKAKQMGYNDSGLSDSPDQEEEDTNDPLGIRK